MPTVIIAQTDPTIALGLANDLHAHFASVIKAEGSVELRTLLLRHEARVAVLDLELVSLDEVRRLAHGFQDVTFVCTHRSPDERMWMAALGAGAVEFCHPLDIRSILRAARTSGNHPMAMAA